MNTQAKAILTLVIGALATVNAIAGDGQFYVGGTQAVEFGGDSTHTWGSDDSEGGTQINMFDDPGYGLDLQFGYDFGKFRTEFEVGHHRTETDKVSLVDGDVVTRFSGEDGYTQNSKLMINGFYDHKLTERWGLYVGAGVGVNEAKGEIKGTMNGDSTLIKYNDSFELSYQAMIGVSFKATEKIDLTFGYRRGWNEDVSLAGMKIETQDPESLEAGIRFSF